MERKGVEKMKIVLRQYVGIKGKNYTNRGVSKTFENNVIPHVGMFIADSAYKEPYEHEVEEVVVNYDDNTCYVLLKAHEIEADKEISGEEEKQVVHYHLDVFKTHGWEVPSY